MKPSTSWKVNSCSATQQVSSISSNLKIHYHVHNSQPLVPVLGWMKSTPSHIIYLRFILILPSHLHLDLPSGVFPSGLHTKPMYACLSHTCYMPCPSHPPWFDHSNNFRQEVQITKFLIIQFSPAYYSICLRSKYSWHRSETPSVYIIPKFHTHTNNMQNYRFLYFKSVYFLTADEKIKDSQLNFRRHSLHWIYSAFLHECNFGAVILCIWTLIHFQRPIIFHYVMVLPCIQVKRYQRILGSLCFLSGQPPHCW
jgi:hypothetical protein